ncbi:MAG: hypothetical protein KatS3mg105_3285 [Gemmatales bacterium]|nr:MAG: hypothetical protein KatS3mg105_3285 [Gemmatales bacterium]
MKRYARSDAAERAVLGSMIRDNTVIGRVLQIVRDSHFRCDAHQRVFRTVVALFQDGKPIDLETLANKLYAAGDIEHIGGYGLLGQLWDAAPTAANAEHYAQTVREAAIVRQLSYVAAEIASTCEKPNDSADRLLSDAIRKLEDLAGNATQGSLIDARRLMAMAADAIDRRATGQTPESLPTGLPALDEFDVMRSGELVIIGARPSCGKTALLLAIMRHVSVAEGLPVFFCEPGTIGRRNRRPTAGVSERHQWPSTAAGTAARR